MFANTLNTTGTAGGAYVARSTPNVQDAATDAEAPAVGAETTDTAEISQEQAQYEKYLAKYEARLDSTNPKSFTRDAWYATALTGAAVATVIGTMGGAGVAFAPAAAALGLGVGLGVLGVGQAWGELSQSMKNHSEADKAGDAAGVRQAKGDVVRSVVHGAVGVMTALAPFNPGLLGIGAAVLAGKVAVDNAGSLARIFGKESLNAVKNTFTFWRSPAVAPTPPAAPEAAPQAGEETKAA